MQIHAQIIYACQRIKIIKAHNTAPYTFVFMFFTCLAAHTCYAQSGLASSEHKVPPPTVSIAWSPYPLLAGLPYTRTTKTTDASSLQRHCTTTGDGWRASEQDMPINATVVATAEPKWVGFPTQCVWTAIGPGGKIAIAETITTIDIPGLVPVWRLRRADGVYFWTANPDEMNYWNAQAPPNRYTLEGIAFKAFKSNTSLPNLKPVHLLVQPNGDHFYTLETAEYNYWRHSPDSPFKYTGIYWYGATESIAGAIPLNRFWIPENNSHFYTMNEQEKNAIFIYKPHWVYEGISHYVWP